MNKKNIKKLINRLRYMKRTTAKPQVGFNMSTYIERGGCPDKSGHDCGTVACLAGHATLLAGETNYNKIDAYAYDTGKTYLGLTEAQADALFLPDTAPWAAITLDHAIGTLEHLLEAGEVTWTRAMP